MFVQAVINSSIQGAVISGDAPSRASLMEVMEDRHGKRSTIITSQLPVEKWYDIIGEKTVADAILDRLDMTPKE